MRLPTGAIAYSSRMDLQLSGKVALVTGRTAGIGYAIAAGLAREGARVIINGRTQRGVAAALAKLAPIAPIAARGFAGDCSTEAAAHPVVQEFPDVEILVNNLGIFEAKPFEEIPDADWRPLFEGNVLSGVRLARLYLAGMRRRDWGRIIFISSESAIQIPIEMIHYGMTKTAQLAVARGLAEAVAGTGITVNSILPGPTRSRGVVDFVDSLSKTQGVSPAQVERDFFKNIRPTSLIKRFATPEEVASLVAYVASPLAAATTGAALRVDGGVVRSAF